MKRIFGMILVLCMIVNTVFVVQANTIATSGICGDGIEWNLSGDGTLTITGNGKMYNFDFCSSPWYNSNSEIKSIVIKNGITSIGDYAFYNCSYITSVNIPGTVKYIGDDAFAYCYELAEITGCDGVEAVYASSFYRTAYYNNSENRKDGILYFNNFIIDVDDTVAKIHLSENTKLAQDIKLNYITEFTVDDNNKNCYTGGYGEIYSNDTLLFVPLTGSSNSLVFPDGIKYISESVCYGDRIYNDIEYIDFGSSCLGGLSDYNFPNIKKLTGFCGNNTKWELDKTNGKFHISGLGNTWDYESQIYEPWGFLKYYVSQIIIDDGITSIGDRLLVSFYNVKNIDIPDTVTRIGDIALGFSGYQKLNIGKNVTDIGMNFTDSSPIRKFTVDAQNSHFSTDEYGVLYNKDKTVLVEFPHGSALASYNVLSSTKEVLTMFERGDDIDKIYVPKSVQRMYTISSDIYYEGTEDEWTSIEFIDEYLPDWYNIYYDCEILEIQKYPLITPEEFAFEDDYYEFDKDQIVSITGKIVLSSENETALNQICQNLSVKCVSAYRNSIINSNVEILDYTIGDDLKSATFMVCMSYVESDYVRVVVSLDDLMEAQAKVKLLEKKQYFTHGVDTQKFSHFYGSFFDDPTKKVDQYSLSEKHWKVLENMLNNNIISDGDFKEIQKTSKKQVYPASKEPKWGGACFGVSTTLISNFLGTIKPSHFDANAANFYEIDDYPVDNENLKSTINFYQLISYAIKPSYKTYKYANGLMEFGSETVVSYNDFWMNLVDSARGINEGIICPLLFTFTYTEGGHAVIIYDFEETDEQYLLYFYDINGKIEEKKLEGITGTIKIDKNTYDFDMADANMKYNNIKLEDTWKSLGYFYTLDVQNLCSYINEKPLTDFALMSEMGTENKTTFIINEGIDFTLENQEGKILEFNDGIYRSDMTVYDIDYIGNQYNMQISFEIPYSEIYYLNCDNAEFSVYNNEYYYGIQTKGATSISKDGVEIFGNDINASVWTSVDNSNCQLVKVDLSAEENVKLSVADNSVLCTSDNVMTNLSASAFYHNLSVLYNLDDNTSVQIPVGDNSIHKITFIADETEFVRIVKDGEILSDIPSVPQKENYTGSWEISDFSNICEDLTVNAVWEPLPHTESTVTYNGTSYVVNTNIYKLKDCILVVAGYNDGKLESLKIVQYTQNTEEFIFDGNYDKFKIIVMDNLSHLKPLCKSDTIIGEQFIIQ